MQGHSIDQLILCGVWSHIVELVEAPVAFEGGRIELVKVHALRPDTHSNFSVEHCVQLHIFLSNDAKPRSSALA